MNNAPPVVELIERSPGWWECPIRAEALYGFSYWEEYRARDRTPMGYALTAARVDLVRRHGATSVLDVGIGGGAFLSAAKAAGLAVQGTDINEHALGWLQRRGERWDGTGEGLTLTFWDSIEHIEDAGAKLLEQAGMVFLSTPIYRDQHHARTSRHWKPGEHIAYFTDAGLRYFMALHDFECIDQNTMESDLGRDGIGSYVFRRIP